MPDIKFELTLPQGANSPFVIVAGGADADHDGTIEDEREVESFKRTGDTWSRTQSVDGPLSGTMFYVSFTVGPNVPYVFTITDAGGAPLYQCKNMTIFHTAEIRWRLP